MSIKLADTLAPMADFPAAMAENVEFTDGESLQEKLDNGTLGAGGADASKTLDIDYMKRIDKCSFTQIGQKEGYSKGYLREYNKINKLVVIGNSITMHGRREEDGIEWMVDDYREMAATYPNSGWVNLVRNYLSENVNPDIKVYKTNGSAWEVQTNGSRDFSTGIANQRYAEVKQDRSYLVEEGTFSDILTDDVDVIIIQFSENMAEPATDDEKNTFAKDFLNLYSALLKKCPNARIFQHCGFWANYNKFKAINSAMMTKKDINITPIFAPMLYGVNKSYTESHFQSSVGASILDSDGNVITTVTSAVATHPGDAGFRVMANQTLHALFNSGGANSYEARPIAQPNDIISNEIFCASTGNTTSELEEIEASVLQWFLFPGKYKATFKYPQTLQPSHGYLKVDVSDINKQYLAIKQEVVSANSNSEERFWRRSLLSGTSLVWGAFEYPVTAIEQFTANEWKVVGKLGTKRISEIYYTLSSDIVLSANAWTEIGTYPFSSKIIEASLIPYGSPSVSQDYRNYGYNIRMLSEGSNSLTWSLTSAQTETQTFKAGDIVYIKIIEL